VSGDGYGEILIPNLKEKGKKVIIVARQGNENKTLKSLADKFYFLDELPKLLKSYKLAA
jgi:carbamoylphosphate synthase large subunit